MDSDQERPVIRSTMPVLFCQSCHISFPFIRINFIVQCVERSPYHVVIQFNNWLNSISDSMLRINGDIIVINDDKQKEEKNSVALLFRGYSFLNNVGTSLSFVAPQNFMLAQSTRLSAIIRHPSLRASLHSQPMTYRYTHQNLATDICHPYTGGNHNRDAWYNLRQYPFSLL